MSEFKSCIYKYDSNGKDIIAEEININEGEIEEWPHKWETPILYWDLVSDSPDIEGVDLEEKCVKRALLRWQVVVSDLKFRKWRTNKPSPRIRIEFRTGEQDEMFAKSKGTLAYAYFPGQGDASGKVVFNDDNLWSTTGKGVPHINQGGQHVVLKTYILEHVLIHEFGHMLGLRHNKYEKESVMYPYYSCILDLSASDIARIQNKYGERSIWKQLLNRLQGYFNRTIQ